MSDGAANKPSKAIKLNGVIYYSKPKPNPEFSWDRENHWDILARVVKELCPDPVDQQKLLDDIDNEAAPVEFGYPKNVSITYVPEGFTTIERDIGEYVYKARENLRKDTAVEAIQPEPRPVEASTPGTREGFGLPGYSAYLGDCNCASCREWRAIRSKEKETKPLVLGQTGPI